MSIIEVKLKSLEESDQYENDDKNNSNLKNQFKLELLDI